MTTSIGSPARTLDSGTTQLTTSSAGTPGCSQGPNVASSSRAMEAGSASSTSSLTPSRRSACSTAPCELSNGCVQRFSTVTSSASTRSPSSAYAPASGNESKSTARSTETESWSPTRASPAATGATAASATGASPPNAAATARKIPVRILANHPVGIRFSHATSRDSRPGSAACGAWAGSDTGFSLDAVSRQHAGCAQDVRMARSGARSRRPGIVGERHRLHWAWPH